MIRSLALHRLRRGWRRRRRKRETKGARREHRCVQLYSHCTVRPARFSATPRTHRRPDLGVGPACTWLRPATRPRSPAGERDGESRGTHQDVHQQFHCISAALGDTQSNSRQHVMQDAGRLRSKRGHEKQKRAKREQPTGRCARTVRGRKLGEPG